jgi:hypothetical protein
MTQSRSTESHESMVKIRFQDPSSANTETLWARSIESNFYQLENSPFFAYGVSCGDVVEARIGNDEVLEYFRCVRKSGNRTVRVIFQDFRSSDPVAEEFLTELRSLGCSYEGMQPRMVSVNLPPKVDLGVVVGFLKQQPGLQWEYADPTYEQVTNRPN